MDPAAQVHVLRHQHLTEELPAACAAFESAAVAAAPLVLLAKLAGEEARAGADHDVGAYKYNTFAGVLSNCGGCMVLHT